MTEQKNVQVSNKDQELGRSALGVLVKQFGNAFDFVRELVQNSLDSGTPVVEVWTDYHPKGNTGICEIHVDDSGIGMTESIIDNKLTRLFSSTKEDDMTHIGKFGIGFVSVFAIDPDGVLIKTARGGERWEIFFDGDRNIEKTALLEPFEGTHITVFKVMTPKEYNNAVQSTQDMLTFWCKHAEKKILFWDGAKQDTAPLGEFTSRRRSKRKNKIEINTPMGVTGYCPITVKKGESEIAVAFSNEGFYGFYNQGLTLTETSALDLPAKYKPYFGLVSFKIKSPYLEHTLTRDTVLRDDNFFKALDLLVDVVRMDLVEALLDKLEALAAIEDLGVNEQELYLKGLDWLYQLPKELDPTFGTMEKVSDFMNNAARLITFKTDKQLAHVSVDASERKIFRKCHGAACSISQVAKASSATHNTVILSEEEDEMTRELDSFGKSAILSPTNSSAESFFYGHVTGEPEEKDIIPRVSDLSGSFWFVDMVNWNSVSTHHRDFYESLKKVFKIAGVKIRCVNFLGDSPHKEVLSGLFLKDNIVSKAGKIGTVGGAAIAVDIYGKAFHSFVDVYRVSPDLALLLAVRQISANHLVLPELKSDVHQALMEILS